MLPKSGSERLHPSLELVALPLSQALYESGHRLNDVYFPSADIVSLVCIMENGNSAEIAVVGNEGIVGITLLEGRRCRIRPSLRAQATPID